MEQLAPGDKAGKVGEFLWVSSKNVFCRQLLYDVDVSFHYPIYHLQFMLVHVLKLFKPLQKFGFEKVSHKEDIIILS